MASTALKIVCLVGSGFATALIYTRARDIQQQDRCSQQPELGAGITQLTRSERRFLQFASVEYGRQIYMTPQDFLQSVLERYPVPCLRRRILTQEEISRFQSALSLVQRNSASFFRNATDKGIISFMEYLFLISVLTRPEAGFRLTFSMFDVDGNQRINRKEFLIAQKLLGNTLRQRKVTEDVRKTLGKLEDSKTLTMLQVHFFGKDGNNSLVYEDFHRFMNNLQSEILQIEFGRYSLHGDAISNEDFARILLRYTHLQPHQYETFLRRLHILDNHRQVSYAEFEQFCQVLHNLEDFALAMRTFHSLTGNITREELSRAVRIFSGSGTEIDHPIDIVFAMFDEEGDGRMSYDKFLLVINNRFRYLGDRKLVGWKAFKRCCRREARRD
ncbi:calcium uptake protein 2, mitochondrial-like [Wyeomyia smithii]|uniref:calcium uptake protein 2, mitochondrial-like n=1 Tax=Wyeomyia smithii TaxID=174621 RepID=UPI0024680447|nr:calcium uptake protein 2, mitochondrial-like [Wyeomyia smithii]